MANDFKSLWRKEVEKLNRQIHKYEKEGVRFVYKAMDEEETPKKTYTQADVDLIKAKRLTLFEGATLYDTETSRTYKGKEEITNRIRQRKQQQEQMLRQYRQHETAPKNKKDAIRTRKIASMQDSIYFRMVETLRDFDATITFAYSTEMVMDKLEIRNTIADIFERTVEHHKEQGTLKEFFIAIENSPILLKDLERVLYDSNITFTSFEAQSFLQEINKLFLYDINEGVKRKPFKPFEYEYHDMSAEKRAQLERKFTDTPSFYETERFYNQFGLIDDYENSEEFNGDM